MKLMKKLVCLMAATAMLSGSASVQADNCCAPVNTCCVDNTGCGYDACCESSCVSPALILGAIAVVAIIAVAASSSGGHHHHAHVH
jgi:hypothetical protein